jgi:hypothetical protein
MQKRTRIQAIPEKIFFTTPLRNQHSKLGIKIALAHPVACSGVFE